VRRPAFAWRRRRVSPGVRRSPTPCDDPFVSAEDRTARSSLDKPGAFRALAWIPVGVAAGILVVACFLPAFEIAIEAAIGAGAEQRSFRYSQELSIAGDLLPIGLVPLGAGLVLVGLALVGLARGTFAWACVASLLVALALGAIVFDTDDRRLGWTGASGVIGYEKPNGGPLLQPALDDLRAAAERTPEARNPGWTLGGDDAYAARGLYGWQILLWSSLALCWLTGYRVLRLGLGPWSSVALVIAVTAAVFVWLVLRALGNE
jgi:hypothetical protein